MNTEILILKEFSSAVIHNRNAGELLDKILSILNQRLGMLRGIFTLRQGDVFQIEASFGLEEAEKRRGRYRLGEGITGKVAESGKSCIVADIARDKNFLNRTGSYRPGEHLAFLCVPVIRHERIIGTFSIERATGSAAEQNRVLNLLEIISNLAADAFAVRKLENEEKELLNDENRRLREALQGSGNPGKLIGNSNVMRKVYEQIRQFAPSNATVLFRGAPGSGKALAAKTLYQLSNRADQPLLNLNCATLPEILLESELFGHEKGSFAGAVERKIGCVESANGGTLFLDEIGFVAPALQVKLLRFIQERTFSRIGSNDELKSDVRVIVSTSCEIEELITQGKFCEDLYNRLKPFQIIIPELCKHRSDIILLAEHFIAKHNLHYGKQVERLSTPAINMLMTYHWPGNVIELENCIERAVLNSRDNCIHGYNLPPSLQTGKSTSMNVEPSFQTLVDSYSRELIVEALKNNLGNMSAAARDLNLSPRMMHYNIHRLGINPEWYRIQKNTQQLGVGTETPI